MHMCEVHAQPVQLEITGLHVRGETQGVDGLAPLMLMTQHGHCC